MRIVFDGRWIGRTGIGRYAEELLNQLQVIDAVNEYFVLLVPDVHATWKPTNPRFQPVLTTHEVYTWQEQVLLPRQISGLKPDLVHFTSFNVPLAYGGPFIVTIHDLTLVNYKNTRGSGLKKILYEAKYTVMKRVLANAVRGAQSIITPTRFVADELAEHYPATKDKTTVTWEAVSETFATPANISRLKIPERYVLYVGNYYEYKNVERLVRAFVRTDAYKAGTALVLNGKQTFFQDRIREIVKDIDTDGRIIFPGYTTDGEMASLYKQAQIFIFPSLSEGFGLPGLEAMAQGVPVLAARASCFPEVYADAADYFDPYDIADIAEKIDALLNDKAEQASLKQAGFERIKRFSWRTMAEQTLKLYQSN